MQQPGAGPRERGGRGEPACPEEAVMDGSGLNNGGAETEEAAANGLGLKRGGAEIEKAAADGSGLKKGAPESEGAATDGSGLETEAAEAGGEAAGQHQGAAGASVPGLGGEGGGAGGGGEGGGGGGGEGEVRGGDRLLVGFEDTLAKSVYGMTVPLDGALAALVAQARPGADLGEEERRRLAVAALERACLKSSMRRR
jgi:hypothetical protein